MGKNLKGKQLGKGLGQRKDGLYYARCRNYRGEREERCFKTLPEAKNWRQEQLYLRLHPESQTVVSPNMTVDAWFNQWVKDVVGNRAPNTVRNYRERYEHNIQPFIGSMLLRDVKQIDCQRILNAMEDDYAGSTIRLVFINWRTGMPAKNSSYDTHLYKLCDDAGIERFCMHALRHTYATRAIESGMQPKVLQKLLGHASITTTMNRYVHVTDDSMKKAVAQFAKAQEAQKG